MRIKTREHGRFVSFSGLRKVVGSPGGCYELFVVDASGYPVSHLTEWYRLRKSPGPNGTRRTYLGYLLPFFGYLLKKELTWNHEPGRIRTYIKAFLQDEVACKVSPDSTYDGYQLNLTGASPLSQSSMIVLLAAIRDFYAVMAEAGLYAFANPMCSTVLQQWKREHIKNLASSGAPDRAGTREETWQETNNQPTAYFRLKRGKPWQPEVALTSEQIQQRMNKDLDWMMSHASTQRDRLVFLLLRQTGARLNEILSLTAGGYRKAKGPYRAYVVNKGSYGREEKLIRLTPAIEAALVRYVRTERARHDLSRRKRLQDLDDADPIFLTRRHTAYNRVAFYHHWRQLFAARPRQKEGKQVLQPLDFTPHDIRHLYVTEWLTKIKKKCIGDIERASILRQGLQRRMAWRSPRTIECYDHSFTEQEQEEALDTFQREVEQEQEEPSVATKRSMKTRSTEVSSESPQSKAMRQAAADLEFWKDDL